jgi:hypothetical protein
MENGVPSGIVSVSPVTAIPSLLSQVVFDSIGAGRALIGLSRPLSGAANQFAPRTRREADHRAAEVLQNLGGDERVAGRT